MQCVARQLQLLLLQQAVLLVVSLMSKCDIESLWQRNAANFGRTMELLYGIQGTVCPRIKVLVFVAVSHDAKGAGASLVDFN